MAAYDASDVAAQSTPGNSTELKKFASDFHTEYLRENRFAAYMGGSKKSAVIVNHRELVGKGKEVSVPIVHQLRGGRKGLSPLVGAESQMYADTMNVRPIYIRDAVTIRTDQEQKSFIDLLKARKHVLKGKAKDDLYVMMLEAFRMIGVDPDLYDVETAVTENILYENATGTQLDQWNTENPYRVFYGADAANRTAGNHATSIAALGATDKVSATLLRRLKSEAQARNFAKGPTARSALHPVEVSGLNESFVVFMGTKEYNDAAKDEEIKEAYLHAARTGLSKNRIFQGGDCIYFDNLIIKKVPEMDGVNPSATVGRISFCGASAFARGEGDKLKMTKRSEDDYGVISGVGYQERYTVQKTMFKDKNVDEASPPLAQYGVMDCFVTID